MYPLPDPNEKTVVIAPKGIANFYTNNCNGNTLLGEISNPYKERYNAQSGYAAKGIVKEELKNKCKELQINFVQLSSNNDEQYTLLPLEIIPFGKKNKELVTLKKKKRLQSGL